MKDSKNLQNLREENLRNELNAIIGTKNGPKEEKQRDAIKAFLVLDDAHFDFKRSLDLIIPQQFLTKDGLSNFARWLTYKIMRFGDCDNSYLAQAVYVTLWNEAAEGFHADTMNSMATTLNKYMKERIKIPDGARMSPLWIARDFNSRGEESYRALMGPDENDIIDFWSTWNKFARNTGCLGNFTLIPNEFNRGRASTAQDYWDCSLILLKEKLGEDNFAKYINTFFLWDYVEKKDDTYVSQPLFGSNEGKGRCSLESWTGGKYEGEESLLPSNDNEFADFLTYANDRIERRSIFMTAMLKIAVCDDEQRSGKRSAPVVSKDYENIMDYLMDLGKKQVIPVSLNQAVNELLKANENGQLPLKDSNSQDILKDTLRKLNRNPLKSRSRAALLFSAIPSGTSGSNP